MFITHPCSYPLIPGKPFLRFFALPADTGTGTGDPAAQPNPDEFLPGDAELDDAAFAAKRGFPRATPRDTMTPEQQIAYYRYESKKQQRLAEKATRENTEWAKLGKREDIAASLSKQEQDRIAALGDNERAIETAKVEARAEGVKTGRDLYLPAAVEGQILAVARGADEAPDAALARIRSALEFVDTTKFLDADGALDVARLQSYAATLAPAAGSAPAQQNTDPLSTMLGRQSAPTPGSGGSMADLEAAAYEKRKPAGQ
jgi:hypothetical protein